MPKPNYILRRERERRGLSQHKVALALDTTPKNIGRWERGETVPTPYFRERLCQLFDMDAQELGFISDTLHMSDNNSAIQVQTAIIDPVLPRLPLPTTHIIGREELVMKLLMHLQKGEDCILTGLPGVGKTTLAQLISIHPLRETFFPDGVLWINLSHATNIYSEMQRLAALLQVPEHERMKMRHVDAWSCYLHRYIAGRRLLLIIDDAWSVETVHPFLIGGLHAAHLLTTRLPEVAYAFPSGKIFPVSEFDPVQSYKLLTTLVPQLEESAPEVIQQALATCGGLPLAVVLLGCYVRTQAIGGQRRRLETALQHFTNPQHLYLLAPSPLIQASVAHRITSASLETVIGLSDQYLPLAAQQALRALSVLPAKPNTFSEAVALAVSQQASNVLDCLVDAGLLESAGQGRYMLHQTIVNFARLHLHDDTPLHYLLDYLLHLYQQGSYAAETLLSEETMLLHALETTIQRGWFQEQVQLTLQAIHFWLIQGHLLLAEHYLTRALQIARTSGEITTMMPLLLHIGEIYEARGTLL